MGDNPPARHQKLQVPAHCSHFRLTSTSPVNCGWVGLPWFATMSAHGAVARPERGSPEWKPIIKALYDKFRPKDEGDLTRILEKYKGSEQRLHAALVLKYQGPCKLPKGVCRTCGRRTNPPHWGDACPLRAAGEGELKADGFFGERLLVALSEERARKRHRCDDGPPGSGQGAASSAARVGPE